MKKMFTLILAAGMFTVASAQSKGFDHGKQPVTYTYNSIKFKIDQVNRSYDIQIMAIKQNRHMSRWEKDKQVKQLEKECAAAIARLQYSGKNDHQFDKSVYAHNAKGRY